MKRLIFLILLFGATKLLLAQDTASVNGYIRENIRDKRPDKVTAEQLQQALLKVSNFAGSNIANQNSLPLGSVQQAAKAYIDSFRANYLKAVEPFKARATNGNIYRQVFNASATIDSFSKMARGGIFGVAKTLSMFDGITAASPWGAGVFYPENTGGFTHVNYMPKGTWRFNGTNDFIYSNLAVNSNIGGSADSVNLYFLTGIGGYSSISVRNDLAPGNLQYVNNYGDWSSYTSHFKASRKATSYIESLIHFNATPLGGTNWGQNFGRVIGLNIENLAGGMTVYRPWAIYQQGTNDRSYFAGKVMVGDSSVLNLDVHRFYVSGSSKFSGNIMQSGGRMLLNGVADDGITPFQLSGNASILGNFSVKIYGNSPFATFDGDGNNGFSHILLKNANPTGVGYVGLKFTNYGGEAGWIVAGNTAGGNGYTDNLAVQALRGNLILSSATGDVAIASGQLNPVYRSVFKAGGTRLLINTTTDDATNALQVNGNIKLTGVLLMPATTAPTSSSDPGGTDGEIRRDAAGNVYIKFGGIWKKFVGAAF